MTEPTNEKLRALAVIEGGMFQDDHTSNWYATDAGLLKFARSVLAESTTPQPTQAQAGAVPTVASVEMIDAAMVEMKNIVSPLRRSECRRLIDAALNQARTHKGADHD